MPKVSSEPAAPPAASFAREQQGHTVTMLEQTLDRTQELIRAVDVKTALYMGIATGMAAALPALVQAWDKATPWTWVILVIGTAGPTFCSIFCAIATFPLTDASRPSLLYFGTIARLEPREFCERVTATSGRDYCEDLAFQVHRNAMIASWKYRKLKLGIWGFVVGLPCWLAAVYLLASGS